MQFLKKSLMQNKRLGFSLRVISEIAEQNRAVALDPRIFSQAETGPWQVMVPLESGETAGRACSTTYPPWGYCPNINVLPEPTAFGEALLHGLTW